jgi:superfamily I DNA/RNA helicase
MGLKAVGRAFPKTRIKVDGRYTEEIITRLTGRDIWDLRRKDRELLSIICQLVDLCKMNLVNLYPDGDPDERGGSILDLAAHYDIDLNGRPAQVLDLVPRVLEESKNVAEHGVITYADMIWLPIALNLNVYRYDMLLVDEAQDLNRCQQALATRAGRRLILCGDPRQAIYGFAGADSESMSRMERELTGTDRGCIHLPLTVTRRCGRAIVAEAKQLVPDFDAHETNPEGKITFRSMSSEKSTTVPEDANNYHLLVADGDMVLCRCNAPLVSECFRFIKNGRKANIQGRDVGAGLIRTVEKLMKGYVPPPTQSPRLDSAERQEAQDIVTTAEIVELHRRLSDYTRDEMAKEHTKRNPSEQRIINLQDKEDCIGCFTEGAKTTAEVVAKINAVFTDDKDVQGIRLSSVHKAKGLEAKRVFILTPKGAPMPHPMAKSPWERAQEMNIKYVAITRAIEELVYVS